MEPQDYVLIGLSVATLAVAVVAAQYALRTYQLKSGIELRGSYSIMQSVAAEDRYVGEVLLENLKDRAVVIFGILLEVNQGYLIEVELFEDEPLVLGPFQAFQRQYDPIDLYSVGMQRIRMDRLLASRKTRLRLVLSTSQGRYNVRDHINRWHPVVDLFRNHLTALVRPLRSTYEGKAYGSATKYIVELLGDSGKREIIPIYPGDHRVQKFRGFRLTPESLESRESLELYLLERAVAGELRCSDFHVMDFEEWRREIYRDHSDKEAIEAEPRSWFTYRVLGWLLTQWDNFSLWRTNRDHRRRHQEKLRSKTHSKQ